MRIGECGQRDATARDVFVTSSCKRFQLVRYKLLNVCHVIVFDDIPASRYGFQYTAASALVTLFQSSGRSCSRSGPVQFI